MPMMLWIAAIVEGVIENYADMGILLGIQVMDPRSLKINRTESTNGQLVNASISFYETTKAADAVAALKASLKPKATCKRDGKWSDINATDLVPGAC